jgi:hypothetical protein
VACIKVVELVLELASLSYLLTCCLVKLVENLNRLFTLSNYLDLTENSRGETVKHELQTCRHLAGHFPAPGHLGV